MPVFLLATILVIRESVPLEAIRHSSMAKDLCPDVAMRTTVEEVQALGDYTYMMRQAKITRIYEGTNEIQRIVIASTL